MVSAVSSEAIVHICTACRAEGEPLEPREQRSGSRLFRAMAASRRASDPHLAPVECLSVCKRPCTISFSSPGSWTYIYGDFPADADPSDLWAAARLYAASPQGLIPWKQRPEALKRGVVARVPPLDRSTEI